MPVAESVPEPVVEDATVVEEVSPEAAHVEEEKKPKEKKPIGRNAGKKQGANRNKPRQVSREARKKYTRDVKEEEVVTHVEIPEDIKEQLIVELYSK